MARNEVGISDPLESDDPIKVLRPPGNPLSCVKPILNHTQSRFHRTRGARRRTRSDIHVILDDVDFLDARSARRSRGSKLHEAHHHDQKRILFQDLVQRQDAI